MKETAVYENEREEKPYCGSKWDAPCLCQGMPTAENKLIPAASKQLSTTEYHKGDWWQVCRKDFSLSATVGTCMSLKKNFLPCSDHLTSWQQQFFQALGLGLI